MSGFDVAQDIGVYYEQRQLNQNPLERAEQNFDEKMVRQLLPDGPRPAGLQLVRNIPLEEFHFAESVAKKPVKVTLIGPDRIAQRFKWESSKSIYKDLDAFVADVVAIERQMIKELVEAGCKYIQIDASLVIRPTSIKFPFTGCAPVAKTPK